MSGWDRDINLTRVSISTTPFLEFGSPEKFLYNLEQTPAVTNMLINPLLTVRECFSLSFTSPRKNHLPRAMPTPACSKRKRILRALFIHFIWEQMLPPKPIISGMALITAEVREQSKYRMERWRSLLTCGLHQELPRLLGIRFLLCHISWPVDSQNTPLHTSILSLQTG